MIEEQAVRSFLQKIIEETKSGKLIWERRLSPDSEYGMGYIYSAVLKNDMIMEIFRYCNSSFTMGDVLPSFKLCIGRHVSQYMNKNNDSCHKLIINLCILIDSIIQNDSDQAILNYIK